MTAFIEANLIDKVRDYWEKLPERTEQALSLALNDTVRGDGLAMLRSDTYSQVAFPKGYLETGDRLQVSKYAKPKSLMAAIAGRDRVTSLARFAKHGQTIGSTRRRGVSVKVKSKGAGRHITDAFLIGLKNGNTGLAIRTKDGQAPKGAYKPVQFTRNGGEPTGIWLLYGPSVDQVFRGVAAKRTNDIADLVMKKFYRQFSRL